MQTAADFSAPHLDCLVVSTGRAASTSLYHYLSSAAGLNLPVNKEPHFWSDFERYNGIYPALKTLKIENNAKYWELYRYSIMSIDASVGYFFDLETVITNLQEFHLGPKVIYLYREPVSRARSWFNVRTVKGLNVSSDFLTDVLSPKPDGMWWEHYYDNVLYEDRFRQLEQNFDQVLAINYDLLARRPADVAKAVFDFLGLPWLERNRVPLMARNSSRELLTARSIRSTTKGIRQMVPKGLRNFAMRGAVSLGTRFARQSGLLDVPSEVILDSLPVSAEQYAAFRRNIRNKDIFNPSV